VSFACERGAGGRRGERYAARALRLPSGFNLRTIRVSWRASTAVAVLVVLLAALGLTGVARADTPPNPNDPCAAAGGRDSCATTAAGQYATYSFGTRWFGSYHGAVRGVAQAGYCIDLGFWYPGPNYGYSRRSTSGLHNQRGGAVSDTDLHQMAYALWQFGRTSSADQASATMLYVHSLMGDAQPGELSPPLGSGVGSTEQMIAAQSAKFAGPYTIQATMPSQAIVGDTVKATVALKAASGATVPGVDWKISLSGAGQGAKAQVASDGVDTVTYTASGTGQATLHASAVGVASDLPTLYVPTKGAAADSGQRLVFADSQTVATTASATVAKAQLTLSTKATPSTVTLGATDSDSVTLGGAPAGLAPKVTISAYGPAASVGAVACTGKPAFTASFTAKNGTVPAPAFTPTTPGVYAYQLTIAPSARATGVTTPCGGASESFTVFAQPVVHTVVSATAVSPGTPLTDTVMVSGLGNQPATVTANLYGPYPSPSKMTCTGAPVSSGSIPVQADGSYKTAPVTLTTPGYYVYVESIAAVGFVKAASTQCSDTSETTIVNGAPTVTTQVSDATAAPGTQISDTAVVSGLGVLTATVKVQLFGPYASRKAIDCSGAPASTTTLTATGDGKYQSQKVTVPLAGYYTFHESIAATPAYPAVDTPCAAASETTFAQGTPQIATDASSATVRPGSALSDHLQVTGLGKTPATVTVDLYGPYASVAQIDCSGRPAAERSMKVGGDGSYMSPSVTIPKVGFYVFRERIDGSPLVKGVTTECADSAETSLGSPAIITGGRGPFPHMARQASTQPAGATPSRIEIPGLNITAPVDPITINLAKGQLGVPSDIHRTGWWRDGAAPGSHSGTVLIAGHVDSAAAGAGAFFPLPTARKGMIVSITTRSGTVFRYRVTGTRRLLKAKLPTGVWDRTGKPRLVLVTCGGQFDPQTGHYPDNIIVFATPV
jgi:hypothetical protein